MAHGCSSSSSKPSSDNPTAELVDSSSATSSSVRVNTTIAATSMGGCEQPIFAQQQEAAAGVEQLLALAGPVDAAAVAAACKGLGFSLVLRDMPKRSRAVAALVGALEQQLGLPAGANLYYTPTGRLRSQICCCCCCCCC
jgi:hypothetical protein